MTKQETQIMKGVAVLLMIFLHLFNQMHNVELCESFIYIGNMPFVYWLSAATNPVSFFSYSFRLRYAFYPCSDGK